MSLNPLFVLAPSPQTFFIDKTTGLPLAGGLVYSYRDEARTIKKYLFTISGTPPNYIYTALPDPIVLSAVGTIQDNSGNDVIPYYFPYDTSPSDPTNPATTTGVVDLYYLDVRDANNVPQFTREGWPNTTVETGNIVGEEIPNIIPNGQFLYNNQPAIGSNGSAQLAGTFNYGGVIGSVSTRQIAPGGWTYEVSTGSTAFATDVVSFIQQPENTGLYVGAPRYVMEVKRSAISADNICDIRLKFYNAFKFSNDQTYTLLFNGNSNTGSPLTNVQVKTCQYYGTSGSSSTPVSTTIETAMLGSPITFPITSEQLSFTFTLPTDTSTTIGTNNDDFIQILIRMPTSGTFDVEMTDFILVPGTIVPGQEQLITPDAGLSLIEALTNAAPTTPSPTTTNHFPTDGSNYYLPMIMTSAGLGFDQSAVGSIFGTIYSAAFAANYPLLLCDGTTYVAGQYSALGVPYSRLQNTLLQNSPVTNVPMFGTGANFITAYAFNYAASAELRLTTNKPGVVTQAAVGTSPFTVAGITTGFANSRNYIAAWNISTANTILALNNFSSAGTPQAADGGGGAATGFTIVDNDAIAALLQSLDPFLNIFQLTAVAATSLASKAFLFADLSTSTQYQPWFTVNGSGSSPGIGTNPIQINLRSVYTAQDVANIVREVMMAQTSTSVIFTAASTITNGAYFTFSTNLAAPNFAVYYIKGVDTPPALGSTTLIPVKLGGSETAAQVATLTQQAINNYAFGVPDWRGMFLRGADPSGTYDEDIATRWSTVTGITGATLGTQEFQQLLGHTHVISGNTTSLLQGGGLGTVGAGVQNATAVNVTLTAGITGGNENRPVNAYVNWFIHY